MTSIVAKHQNTSWNGWGINTNNSGSASGFYRLSSERNLSAGIPMTKNSWNHLIFTFSTDSLGIYLNGALKTVGNWNGTSGETSSSHYVAIGSYRHSSSSGTYFSGLIDDVRIYDRALSAVEVQALHQLGQ